MAGGRSRRDPPGETPLQKRLCKTLWQKGELPCVFWQKGELPFGSPFCQGDLQGARADCVRDELGCSGPFDRLSLTGVPRP